MSTRRVRGRVRRPLAYLLHSLIGLKLSLFLGFVCLTGTIATVSHEIEWLLDPAVRASSDGRTDDWAGMWQLLQDTYPDAYIASIASYDRADSHYFAREATLIRPDGTEFRALIDPRHLTITGERDGPSFHSVMRGLHYYLLLPTEIPFYLVTSLGVVLAVLLVSGVLTYKKFWRGFFRLPRYRRPLRAWAGDLHRFMAVWSLWFITIMSLTSIWYLVERAIPSVETPTPRASGRALLPTPSADAVRLWIDAARRALPGLSITLVAMPYGSGDPVVVQGQWRAALVRERASAVFFDPVNKVMLGTRVAHEMGLLERWVHTADPLHFGNFVGLAGKLVWVLFGLFLTGLCFTGAVIFTKRTATYFIHHGQGSRHAARA